MIAAKDLIASVEAMYGADSLAAMSVNAALTIQRRSKRPRRPVETLDFVRLVDRLVRRAGERVADADEHELSALVAISATHAQAVQRAVDGQRAIGRSWAYIGDAVGVTRQAAFEHWGRRESSETAGMIMHAKYRGGQWDPEHGFRPLAPQPPFEGETIDVNSMYPAEFRAE